MVAFQVHLSLFGLIGRGKIHLINVSFTVTASLLAFLVAFHWENVEKFLDFLRDSPTDS